MSIFRPVLPWLLAVTLGVGAGGLWQLWQHQQTESGELSLQSADGPVTLESLATQLRVIYLGYMSCPDVCPTALSRLGAALYQLSDGERQQIQPLFVSVDPERDTPENLALYAGYFHPLIMGLTGSQARVDQLVAQLQAFYRKVPLPDSALGYSIDHSANFYLLDREGNVVETLPDSLSPDALAERLRENLE